MAELMRLRELLDTYRDGDEHGWETEFAWLRTNHPQQLSELLQSIRAIGFLQPVVLGSDGRVWDGHHRLCIAYDSGFTYVPVEHPESEPEAS